VIAHALADADPMPMLMLMLMLMRMRMRMLLMRCDAVRCGATCGWWPKQTGCYYYSFQYEVFLFLSLSFPRGPYGALRTRLQRVDNSQVSLFIVFSLFSLAISTAPENVRHPLIVQSHHQVDTLLFFYRPRS
jgi:hypothetical protein